MSNAARPERFEGKVALITGAASGIGRAICDRLAAEGARVVGADIDATRLHAVGDEIRASGGRFVGRELDVGDRSACREVVDECVSTYGRLDILGNVAGMVRAAHLPDVTENEYRQMMAVNVDGAFFLAQAAIGHLVEAKGSIINIASNSGLQGVAYLVVYSMTKGAIVNLTKSMAMEYVKTDVRINAIAPGGTNTRLAETFEVPEGVDPELLSRMLGYRGANEPEEVAAFFAFVASDESRGIHGAILPIDRGVTTG
ncbi:MAG: SDR family NAD(P)-dependent oxidoreductase [Acidimicrobiia bacterium]